MALSTLSEEFDSLWVQFTIAELEQKKSGHASKAENDWPNVLHAVQKLRSRYDSQRELIQNQHLKLEERQKEALTMQQQRLEQGIGKLQDELGLGPARIADLRAKLAWQEDEARTGEDHAQNVRKELCEVRAEVTNARNRSKVVTDEVNHMKSRHANQWLKLAQEKENMDSELNKQSSTLANERSLAEQCHRELEKRDREIDATRQELNAQHSEVERLNKARESAIDERRRSGNTAETRAQIMTLRQQLKEVYAAHETLHAGIEQRRISLSTAQAQRTILKETLPMAVAGISDAAANAHASDMAFLEFKKELSQTRSSLTHHERTIAQDARQLANLKAEHARKLVQLETALQSLEGDCESANEAVNLLQKQSSQPIGDTDSSIAEEEMVTNERISMLEKQGAEIKKQIPGLQDQIHSSQEVLQVRLSKVDALKMRVSDAEENLTTIRSQIARAKEQGTRLQKRLELQESKATAVSQHTEMTAVKEQLVQQQKEAMLQETLNILAKRTKDVSDDVSEGNRTLAHLLQKVNSSPSRTPTESIPKCASGCLPAAYSKPTTPLASASDDDRMSRIEALAMSVSCITAENDELEQIVQSPCLSCAFINKISGTPSTTPPSTEGGYKDSMSSPRNDGNAEYSSRRSASPSARQRSSSPGFGASGYRMHTFDQQHTIAELSQGASSSHERLDRRRSWTDSYLRSEATLTEQLTARSGNADASEAEGR